MHDNAIKRSVTLKSKSLGLIKLMRPKQWIKNTFVLAPLIFSGEFLDADAVGHALFALLMFSIASSATYIVNDIHDIESDRLHATKSKARPLASGIVSTPAALILLSGLCTALLLAWFLTPKMVTVITAYLALNLTYTFVLKYQPVLDIFSIAVGFVLRVYAGAIALELPVSSWMFITTLCFALYLAAVKRRQELSQSGTRGRKVLEKYSATLVTRYAEMSATGALMFYSLFVVSSKPALVITIPLVIFGLFRYWFVVEALDGGEAPEESVLSDLQLMLTVVLWIAACAWALWPAPR